MMEMALINQSLYVSADIYFAKMEQATYITLEYAGSYAPKNPDDSKIYVCIVHWDYGDQGGHFDLFTNHGLFPRKTTRAKFALVNPNRVSAPKLTYPSPPRPPAPLPMPSAPPALPAQQQPLAATALGVSPGTSLVPSGQSQSPALGAGVVLPTGLNLDDSRSPPADDFLNGMRTPHSFGIHSEEPTPDGSSKEKPSEYEENFDVATRRALEDTLSEKDAMILQLRSELAFKLESPVVGKVSAPQEVPRTQADASQVAPLGVDSSTLSALRTAGGKIDWSVLMAPDSSFSLPTQFSALASSPDLSHPQLQALKGLNELRDSPKLNITMTFDPQYFKLVHSWIETIIDRINQAFPNKIQLLLDLHNYALKVYLVIVRQNPVDREAALQGFQSMTTQQDAVTTTLFKRWTQFLLDGVPHFIKTRLTVQKDWSAQLLTPAGQQRPLTTHQLSSPLCCVDGIFLSVYLAMYSDNGQQRIQLMNHLLHLPPCKPSTFVQRFDDWCTLLSQLRVLQIRLPDPSQIWEAYTHFTSNVRSLEILDLYFKQLVLTHAPGSFTAHDEDRMFRLLDESSKKIVSIIESGNAVVAKTAAPKAVLAPKAPNPKPAGADPQLLQAGPKGGGRGRGGQAAKPKEAAKPKPNAKEPAPKAPATQPVRVSVCIEWVEQNGTCSKGHSCTHKDGHKWPITQEMKEVCQRLKQARARRNAAGGKGKGKGKGGKGAPAHRRFQLIPGVAIQGGGPSPPGSPPLPPAVHICPLQGCKLCISPVATPETGNRNVRTRPRVSSSSAPRVVASTHVEASWLDERLPLDASQIRDLYPALQRPLVLYDEDFLVSCQRRTRELRAAGFEAHYRGPYPDLSPPSLASMQTTVVHRQSGYERYLAERYAGIPSENPLHSTVCLEVADAFLEVEPTLTAEEIRVLAQDLPNGGCHPPGEACFRDLAARAQLSCPLTPGQQEERTFWLNDDCETWREVGHALYIQGAGGIFRPLPDAWLEPAHAAAMLEYGPVSREFRFQFSPAGYARYCDVLGVRQRSYQRFIEDEWIIRNRWNRLEGRASTEELQRREIMCLAMRGVLEPQIPHAYPYPHTPDEQAARRENFGFLANEFDIPSAFTHVPDHERHVPVFRTRNVGLGNVPPGIRHGPPGHINDPIDATQFFYGSAESPRDWVARMSSQSPSSRSSPVSEEFLAGFERGFLLQQSQPPQLPTRAPSSAGSVDSPPSDASFSGRRNL